MSILHAISLSRLVKFAYLIGWFFSAFQAANRASASPIDVNTDFSDNQLPSGFNLFFLPAPGNNAGVRNQRFEVGQVDTYAGFTRPLKLSPEAQQIEMGFTGVWINAVYGAGLSARVVLKDGTTFLAGFGRPPGSAATMNVTAGADGSSLASLPPRAEPLRLDALFRNGEIEYKLTSTTDGQVLANGISPTPGLLLSEVASVHFLGIMTTGPDIWMDDVRLRITDGGRVIPKAQKIWLAFDQTAPFSVVFVPLFGSTIPINNRFGSTPAAKLTETYKTNVAAKVKAIFQRGSSVVFVAAQSNAF